MVTVWGQLLQAANTLPEGHSAKAAALERFALAEKYAASGTSRSEGALPEQAAASALSGDKLEARQSNLRRERLEIYMQLKELPHAQVRLIWLTD
eukprot:5282408-Pyramimonas_sp.AAC.3